LNSLLVADSRMSAGRLSRFVLLPMWTPAGGQRWRLPAPPPFRRGRGLYLQKVGEKAEGGAWGGGSWTAGLAGRGRGRRGPGVRCGGERRRRGRGVWGSARGAEARRGGPCGGAGRGRPALGGRGPRRSGVYKTPPRRSLTGRRAAARRPPMDFPPPGLELP